MKDLKITWDNPADSSGIDGNYIYRKAGDHTAIVDMAAFRTGAENVGSVGPGVAEYIDTDVPDGVYTYGVFSYNGSGSGPGDLSNEPHTVLSIPVVNISSAVGFRDYTSLVFDHTLTRQDGLDMDETLAGVQYEFKIATDNQMANVVGTVTKSSLINGASNGLTYISREPLGNLTPDTTYFSQLTITGELQGQSSIIEAISNPCDVFNATRISDGDGTHTVNITTTPGALVTVTEELVSPGLRGHMRPALNDEFGNLFIGIAEGSFRGDGANGGKLVFDGGWPKFYSYTPTEISYNDYGRDLWWFTTDFAANHDFGGPAGWTTVMRDFLLGGGDIYDGTVPGQAAYLLNVYNFIKRIDNPTGKILYINDYYIAASGASGYQYLGPQKFVSIFKDVAEYGGLTLEQLDDTIHPVNFVQSHGDALLNKFATSAEWRQYLNGYDLVVYVGVEGPNGYLPQQFIDGMLDYYDDGGGLFATTDHDMFQPCINQLVYNYGVQFSGNIDRTPGHDTYKISEILSNSDYIQYGSHPLFNNLDPNSFLGAGTSEGLISYNTGQFPNVPAISRTSEFTADVNGSVSVGAHISGDDIENRKLVISTSNGCGTVLEALTIVAPAPDSGPSLLRANYDIQTAPQFLQWKYSNGTINAPTWIANSNSFLIPGSAQGGYAIFSAGITSTMLYGGIKDVSYNPAGGQVPNIPIIDVTATDFSAVNGWTFGALTLWPKLPIPYFNAQLEITNFPISYDQYYPLYTTNQQAEDRLNLYGLPINVKQVNIDYPITDVTAASFYVPSTEALTMYLPELPLADGTSNYSDFSKRWDPDVAGGMPHDDASFPIVDQGMIFNGTHYNHDGTSR